MYPTGGVIGTKADCQARDDFSPSIFEMIGRGWAYTSRYSSRQKSILTLGDINIRPSIWTLRKRWPLYEVSGINPNNGDKDCNSRWAAGPPATELSARGLVLESDGPGLQIKNSSCSIFAEGVGTITWAEPLDVINFTMSSMYTKGGKPTCSFRAGAEGRTLVSGTPSDGNDFAWLLNRGGVKDNPIRGRFTYDTNAESINDAAIMYDVTLEWNSAVQGGRVRVDARMRLDD
jgi:hypothetical protein